MVNVTFTVEAFVARRLSVSNNFTVKRKVVFVLHRAITLQM